MLPRPFWVSIIGPLASHPKCRETFPDELSEACRGGEVAGAGLGDRASLKPGLSRNFTPV